MITRAIVKKQAEANKLNFILCHPHNWDEVAVALDLYEQTGEVCFSEEKYQIRLLKDTCNKLSILDDRPLESWCSGYCPSYMLWKYVYRPPGIKLASCKHIWCDGWINPYLYEQTSKRRDSFESKHKYLKNYLLNNCRKYEYVIELLTSILFINDLDRVHLISAMHVLPKEHKTFSDLLIMAEKLFYNDKDKAIKTARLINKIIDIRSEYISRYIPRWLGYLISYDTFKRVCLLT